MGWGQGKEREGWGMMRKEGDGGERVRGMRLKGIQRNKNEGEMCVENKDEDEGSFVFLKEKEYSEKRKINIHREGKAQVKYTHKNGGMSRAWKKLRRKREMTDFFTSGVFLKLPFPEVLSLHLSAYFNSFLSYKQQVQQGQPTSYSI